MTDTIRETDQQHISVKISLTLLKLYRDPSRNHLHSG